MNSLKYSARSNLEFTIFNNIDDDDDDDDDDNNNNDLGEKHNLFAKTTTTNRSTSTLKMQWAAVRTVRSEIKTPPHSCFPSN